jgi:hypothetical protein
VISTLTALQLGLVFGVEVALIEGFLNIVGLIAIVYLLWDIRNEIRRLGEEN